MSVKAGYVSVAHARDLRGVLDREQAEIGVLISFEEPTAPMRNEAASAGFYTSPWAKRDLGRRIDPRAPSPRVTVGSDRSP